MSLVHNYGAYGGLCSRDAGFDAVADARLRGRGPGHGEPLKMRGRRAQAAHFAPTFVPRKRGVKFSRPSFTQRFANLALCS